MSNTSKNVDKIDYASSGVDVNRGYETVDKIKDHAKSTFDSRVLGGLGSFGAAYDIKGLGGSHPILVSATDGVGTKLKYADILNKHDTIGIDCVAMCVNDLICCGAKPLFFLDYIAQSKINPDKVASIVSGIADGCRQSECALIGGETAEMPGFYKKEEYDIAGFAVGIVDKSKYIDGSKIQAGDIVIGLASNGLHSNGYSLVRKLLGEDKSTLEQLFVALECTLAEEVLKPTRLYAKTILSLISQFEIRGIANITGGGWIENMPRMLPQDTHIVAYKNKHDILPIFDILQAKSNLSDQEMFNTFNMGIGMALVVKKDIANQVIKVAKELGEQAWEIGRIEQGLIKENIVLN